jgi:L-ribulose-5-phosphate 4-epimerase
MLHAELREIVYRANIALAQNGLVMGTFGNVSAIDRSAGVLVIKPSGVPYAELTAAHMVVVSLDTGEPLDDRFRPSSDTPTHLELYRAFGCGAVAHTRSEYATAFAQARLPIRCMGTTHADYFREDVPVTRPLTAEEVARDYEMNIGRVIVETFAAGGLVPSETPAVLVANRGPFTWGPDASKAVECARALEYVARLEWRVKAIAADAPRPDAQLIEKHYRRKHGPDASYGQMTGAVLWDLDGTLVDSGDYHWQSWRETLAAEDFDLTYDQFLASFGQKNDRILRGWLGEDAAVERIERLGDAKEAEYRRLACEGGLSALPGAAEWVARLQHFGWRQAVATSAPRLNVEVMLGACGLERFFDTIVSAEDVTVGKPDPQVFQVAAGRLHTPAERCIVVEDAAVGIEAARRAGMRCIGVSGAATLDADIVVTSLADLPPDAFVRLLSARRR